MHLTPNALYLFQQAAVDPIRWSPQEVLARASQKLRTTISSWWEQLEPEATLALPITITERALVDLARAAVKSRQQIASRQSVQWRLNSKFRVATGDRFLTALERLGVVSTSGGHVGFTHHTLLELYLGLGLALDGTLPKTVIEKPRSSLEPVNTPDGRSVIARMALAEPEERESLIQTVAAANLHIASWYLYFDREARTRLGDWLATEILREIHWDQDKSSEQALAQSLASLASEAVAACRTLLDSRVACLPACLAAVDLLADCGVPEDIKRLQEFAAEPALGQWEIDQLRQLLRGASEVVADEQALKRYAREDNLEIAKATAGFLLRLAGKAVVQHASHASHTSHHGHQPPVIVERIAGGAIDHLGGQLVATAGSSFYQQQSALRGLMSTLPVLIDRRKLQISELAAQVVKAAEVGIIKISHRANS